MEYQAKLQEAKLQDTASYHFFLFLGVLLQLLHQQIFSFNFLELNQNYLEQVFCHKNVFKTLLNPTSSTANWSLDKSF